MKKYAYMIIILLTIIMMTSIITKTFSLFQSEGIAIVGEDIGRWKITINDIDATGTTKTFEVNEFLYEESTVVENDKIAPGRNGYFDIILNPSGTDVSILYDIDFDFSKITNKAITTSVEVINGDHIIKTGENKYTGIINLADIQKGVMNTLRVKIKWENIDGNDEIDSDIGIMKNAKITIPVSIHLVQYLGETIVPYNH